jgi:cell division protein FtsN
MARDYGNRRPGRQRSSSPQHFLVLIVTFVLGYASATFFDFKQLSHWVNKQVLAIPEAKQEVAKAEPHAAQVPPKPKFEFYTLLANEKVPSQANAGANHEQAKSAPSTATNSVAAAAVKTAQATQGAALKVAELKKAADPVKSVGKGSYLVQVASFKARKDAEHMKGLLTLKGFDVAVVPVTNARGNWFRVVVGPYSSRLLAQNAQISLAKTERLHGVVTSAGA